MNEQEVSSSPESTLSRYSKTSCQARKETHAAKWHHMEHIQLVEGTE